MTFSGKLGFARQPKPKKVKMEHSKASKSRQPGK
jgi:hypothetical protein